MTSKEVRRGDLGLGGLVLFKVSWCPGCSGVAPDWKGPHALEEEEDISNQAGV